MRKLDQSVCFGWTPASSLFPLRHGAGLHPSSRLPSWLGSREVRIEEDCHG